MSASISRYLKDFSAPKVELSLVPPRYFPDLDDDFPADGAFVMKPQAQPQIDIDAERSEAFAQGRREAEKEQLALNEAEISALNARHAAELEAMRVRCENEIAAMIYDRFSDMGSQLAAMLSDQTARVLAPVMDSVLLQKSIADLARMITLSIGAGEGVKITVKGPAPLFEALKRHLNDETLIFRHLETDDVDLSVEFGDSILVTRMAAWADTVGKVLA
ncbi:hypothetical protein ASE23_03570 [Rhizobium sp. Root73]|uniref:hypothetical protein n=1 Tax=unclassified Rhizobium TaxID=2613769 RepID=UPI000723D9D3|nr:MULTISPECIES: hypothetical protein [unclassified Rhizobium]KQY17723.1 hypothetical protein ASD36_03565 [Rhizobium sp. Root1334]KRC13589.1 hypothetical protein ASE23_03570 [Rhizobium sp. Root73]